MQTHNVNRHLQPPAPSFWDGVEDVVATEQAPGTGPWLEIGQLDLFCSGCAGRTWSHDCWMEMSA